MAGQQGGGLRDPPGERRRNSDATSSAGCESPNGTRAVVIGVSAQQSQRAQKFTPCAAARAAAGKAIGATAAATSLQSFVARLRHDKPKIEQQVGSSCTPTGALLSRGANPTWLGRRWRESTSPGLAEDRQTMLSLSTAALVLASLFAGAAAYISLVEHPARLQLDDRAALAQWKPSYARALPLQSGLAILSGVAGITAGWMTGDWLWFAGSIVMLANWPYTLVSIMPMNQRLKAIPEVSGSRDLLVKWGKLHNVRSLLGIAAVGFFAVASLRTP